LAALAASSAICISAFAIFSATFKDIFSLLSISSLTLSRKRRTAFSFSILPSNELLNFICPLSLYK